MENNIRFKENNKHYASIDGLRVISAIGIVSMHVLANGNYKLGGFIFERLIPSFTELVFLFMIISGFAMCCGYYDKILNNKITVGEFYSKRYAKIWPFFALLSILDFILYPSVNSMYEVFANLTLCFGLLPNANISVIGVGWFLGLVFVFYLVFPFYCYLLSDKRRAWLSFTMTLIFNVLCECYFNTDRTNILYSAVFFFAGGLIYLYRGSLERIADTYQWEIVVVIIILMNIYFYFETYIPIMLLLIFAIMLIFSLGTKSISFMHSSVMRFLSKISMEIYLCHMVIFRIMEKMGFLHLFASDMLSYIITTIGTIIGAMIFSILMKKLLGILKRY